MTEDPNEVGRRRAELRLTEEEMLRLTEETAGIGAFDLDVASDRWTTTQHVAILFGLDPNLTEPSLAEWEGAIFADDRPRLRAAVARSIEGGVLDVEFRVTHSDGSVHWLAAKGRTVRDNAGVVRSLRGTCFDITDRKALEMRLLALNDSLETRVRERTQEVEVSYAQVRDTERRLRLLIESVTDYAIYMIDPEGKVVNWNPGAERLKGYTANEILGQSFSNFYTKEDRASGLPQQYLGFAAMTGKYEGEGWRVRKDGTRFWASIVLHAIRDTAGELLGFAKVTRDLTERREAEEQLRQVQKMEAIGQLTGGIAHDFNNLLTVISGNLETLQRRLESRGDETLQRYVNSALHGASRAALLTHQLLAFSRRQALDPKSVSVNSLITRMSELLRRTLSETIAIETVLAGGVWNTFVDPNQLENSLLNLAVNARDAMPDGGKLTIEAANVYLDEEYVAAVDVPAGQYVGIFISDTGTGMSPDVAVKAFDPFFTTKDVDRGTGLGLSQVYGFVKQSGGHVKIYSEVGVGTTVKIYLPRLASSQAADDVRPSAAPVARGNGETILIVEDEPHVRSFAVGLMRELGYQVLEAPEAATALRLIDSHREIALLFTDVGLPGGMNGRQLADEVNRRRPNLKVLFTSGYARNAIVHHGRLDPGVHLITKPFTFTGLATKLREVLES